MKKIIAQARKELTQVFRDRLSLALALILPLVLLALIGTAISLNVTGLKIAIQDLDRTPLSRQYIDTINASVTFYTEPLPLDERPELVLQNSLAKAVLIIPEHFERELKRNRNIDVQWLIDASDANTANIMRGNAVALTQAFLAQQRKIVPAIKPEIRMWYNPGGESAKYFGPGVFAVVLALFPPLLAALSMSREGEQQTILQVYVSSISAHEFLLGKILAYCLIAFAEWVLALMLAFLLFGLRFAGDPTPLLVGTIFYLFCNISFGTMIGVAIPNQAAAIQAVAAVSFLLSFLLSGFIFPVANIPYGIRWISSIVPARYFIEITRDAFVRGSGWPAVWHAPLILAMLGFCCFFIAWRKLRPMQVQK